MATGSSGFHHSQFREEARTSFTAQGAGRKGAPGDAAVLSSPACGWPGEQAGREGVGGGLKTAQSMWIPLLLRFH